MQIGKYKVEGNELNVIVYKRGGKKKVTWSPEAYFATVEEALKYLVDVGVAETGLKELGTVVAKQKELYELIKNFKT